MAIYRSLRDALMKGLGSKPIQAIGGWYYNSDETESRNQCERLPSACVMGTILEGAKQLASDDGTVIRVSGDNYGKALIQLYPFLQKRWNRERYPLPESLSPIRHDEMMSMESDTTVIDVAITLNDRCHLQRDEITSWLETMERDWITENMESPEVLTSELQAALKQYEQEKPGAMASAGDLQAMRDEIKRRSLTGALPSLRVLYQQTK